MSDQSPGSFLRRINKLSQLGDQKSQALVRSLLELCGATLETNGLRTWLERVRPKYLDEYRVVDLESVSGGKLLIPHPMEGRTLQIGIRDDDDDSVEIEPPPDLEVRELEHYLEPLETELLNKELSPTRAQMALNVLSELKISGYESPKQCITIAGLSYLTSQTSKSLGDLICESQVWSLPDRESQKIRIRLSELKSVYPQRLKILSIQEKWDDLDKEVDGLLSTWLTLLGSVGRYITMPSSDSIPIDVFLPHLETRTSSRYTFSVKSSDGSKPTIEGLLNPILKRIVHLELREKGDLELEAVGPGKDLLLDVLKPLHEQFQLELR